MSKKEYQIQQTIKKSMQHCGLRTGWITFFVTLLTEWLILLCLNAKQELEPLKFVTAREWRILSGNAQPSSGAIIFLTTTTVIMLYYGYKESAWFCYMAGIATKSLVQDFLPLFVVGGSVSPILAQATEQNHILRFLVANFLTATKNLHVTPVQLLQAIILLAIIISTAASGLIRIRIKEAAKKVQKAALY